MIDQMFQPISADEIKQELAQWAALLMVEIGPYQAAAFIDEMSLDIHDAAEKSGLQSE